MNEEKPKFPNDKAFNKKLKENGRIINEAIQDILKETNMNNELIKELEEDVRDCEKSVAQAKESLENEQKWLDREKLRLAEAIIRLHKEKYGDDNMRGTL
jgi:predicted  nucleic acid-binding Zn-ribbon protein